MSFPRLTPLLVAAFISVLAWRSDAASIYTTRLEDPKAVYLTPENFPVKADGEADDSDALQSAINKVQETTHAGVVFIPEGKYRITKTIYVWEGIRLIGYGKNRPTILLGKATPGFQEYKEYKQGVSPGTYMIHFVSGRPRKEGDTIRDANPGTFYSGMSNIDIEIGEGNPAAIGVRFHIAQHCFLAHMDFRTGSGKAGVYEIGNEMEDCHFFEGDYGIMTSKPAPSWPFILIDSSFEGQRVAGIDTEEGGFAIINTTFKKMPSVLVVRPERADILWIKNSLFQDITGPAIVIRQENNARSQTNLRNINCQRVPVLAVFAESGKKIEGKGESYEVEEFSHGLQITDGSEPEIKTTAKLGPVFSEGPEPSDLAEFSKIRAIVPLPPCDTWVNLHDLGAKGDGKTDDTKAIQEAINSHRAIYIPSGRYVVSDTITLKPDTVLIGLNPIMTQIDLPDNTPGFENEAVVKPVIVAPKGGTCIVTGIGIDAGGNNPSAAGMKWMAGEKSLVNDVRFLGGHGTFNPDGSRLSPYNPNHTGDVDPKRHWDSQYASLWITDGGGGTFKDIWTPVTFAQAGVYISDTKTPGRMYAISIEHHVRNEVKIKNVSNWEFYAMQTEEEHGESPRCLPYDIEGCSNLTFANVYLYRVTTDFAFPYGVRVSNSHDIVFHALHAYSPGKTTYDNTVFDVTRNLEIRSREIASLTLTGKPLAIPTVAKLPTVTATVSAVKAVGGFENIDGAAVDSKGNVWFVDPRTQRIYRWSPEERILSLVRDSSIDPSVLAFDKSDNLLIISRSGMVYSCPPGGKDEDITVLQSATDAPKPGAVALYAVNRWRDEHDFMPYTLRAYPLHFSSPDGSVFISADEDFRNARRVQPKRDAAPVGDETTAALPTGGTATTTGTTSATSGTASPAASTAPEETAVPRPRRRGVRSETVDLLRAYSLVTATPGQPLYLGDEFGQRTWKFSVDANGKISDPKLFAEEGEAGVAVDKQGNVYIAAGNVFVYNPAGKLIDTIFVPERPASLVFGGKDRQTLFITARTSLYQFRPKYRGR